MAMHKRDGVKKERQKAGKPTRNCPRCKNHVHPTRENVCPICGFNMLVPVCLRV